MTGDVLMAYYVESELSCGELIHSAAISGIWTRKERPHVGAVILGTGGIHQGAYLRCRCRSVSPPASQSTMGCSLV